VPANRALGHDSPRRLLSRKSIYARYGVASIEFSDSSDIWTAGIGSNTFKDHCDALADADAHRRETELGVAIVHRMNERRGDASP